MYTKNGAIIIWTNDIFLRGYKMISTKNESNSQSVTEPYINEDGYYPQCPKCWTELQTRQEICHCGQLIDWSWLKERKNE